MRAAKASAADHRRLIVQRLRSTAPHRAQTNSHPAGAGPSRCESPHRLHAWIVWTLIPTDSWECCPLNVKHRRPETRGYTRYSKGPDCRASAPLVDTFVRILHGPPAFRAESGNQRESAALTLGRRMVQGGNQGTLARVQSSVQQRA